MVVVKLCGGLGNQLFQYAFGYAVAKNNNDELALDLSFYEHQPSNVGQRDIDLNKMKIVPYQEYNPGIILTILNNKYIGAFTRNLPHVELKISSNMVYFKEPNHRYVEKLPIHRNTYYNGYWQSSRYFMQYTDDIRNMYVSSAGYSKEVNKTALLLQKNSSVAVHIRKGDFGRGTIRKVGHPMDACYYKNAIAYAREHLNSSIFYIFSDNPEWAKQILGRSNDFVYVTDLCKTDTLADLWLMSKCKNGIMSASTFSWWGNWLREEQGLVIVPNGEYYNNCFYEESWIRI